MANNRAGPLERAIRERVLAALARNRTPGFHFAGNFLGVAFPRIGPEESLVTMPAGPHCEESDGQVNVGAIALLADTALAAGIRGQAGPDLRLATVSMHLQFTGAPVAGPLEAAGWCEGFLDSASGRQGLARTAVMAGGRKALFGSGAFMLIQPPAGKPPVPLHHPSDEASRPLAEDELDVRERAILASADAALADATKRHSFIRRLLGQDPHPTKGGAACTMENGDHVANRVGHVQGGLLTGLAATTAMAALPAAWRLSGISSWFTSPGEGQKLHAVSKVVHHGRQTAVVRTVVTGKGRRRVLQAVTTHIHGWRADAPSRDA
jgi:acyl-coenzyme A thioesterase PaaI-like protein